MQPIMSEKTFWNHVGFHHRPVWVIVCVDPTTQETITRRFDKKNDALKYRRRALTYSKKFCYVLSVKAKGFYPDTIWKNNKPAYQRKLSKMEKAELGIKTPRRRRRGVRNENIS